MRQFDELNQARGELAAAQERNEALELAISDHLAAVVAWRSALLALNAYAVVPQAEKRVQVTQSRLAELLTLSAPVTPEAEPETPVMGEYAQGYEEYHAKRKQVDNGAG